MNLNLTNLLNNRNSVHFYLKIIEVHFQNSSNMSKPANDFIASRRLLREDGLGILASELLTSGLQSLLVSSIGYWTGTGNHARRFICLVCQQLGKKRHYKCGKEAFKHVVTHNNDNYLYGFSSLFQCPGCLHSKNLIFGTEHMTKCLKLQCRACHQPITIGVDLNLRGRCDCRDKYTDKRDWVQFVDDQKLRAFLKWRLPWIGFKTENPDSKMRDYQELMQCLDVDDFSLEENISLVFLTATGVRPSIEPFESNSDKL